SIEKLVGAIEYAHAGGGGAACVTAKVCPAIVTVPVRAASEFALTINATLPLPEPGLPLVIETHGTADAAVHAHPAPAVTATLTGPPVSLTDWLVGEMANVHVGVAAACVTVKV